MLMVAVVGFFGAWAEVFAALSWFAVNCTPSVIAQPRVAPAAIQGQGHRRIGLKPHWHERFQG